MSDWLGSFDEPLPPAVKLADFAYWCRSEAWYLHEAVSIALGAEPESAEQFVQNFSNGYSHDRIQSNFVIAYKRLKLLSERNFVKFQIHSKVPVTEYLSWLAEARLPLPNELKLAHVEFGRAHVDWKVRAEKLLEENEQINERVRKLEAALADNAIGGSGSTRSRETLLKIIFGVAVEQYGFDPAKGRNEAARQISDDLQLHGLSVSDDTIRNYLKEAVDLYSVSANEA